MEWNEYPSSHSLTHSLIQTEIIKNESIVIPRRLSEGQNGMKSYFRRSTVIRLDGWQSEWYNYAYSEDDGLFLLRNAQGLRNAAISGCQG